jgi:hypothetical protein
MQILRTLTLDDQVQNVSLRKDLAMLQRNWPKQEGQNQHQARASTYSEWQAEDGAQRQDLHVECFGGELCKQIR